MMLRASRSREVTSPEVIVAGSGQLGAEYEDHQIKLPPEGIKVKVGEYVEFIATSKGVTCGFGVFRKDGTISGAGSTAIPRPR